ncbi:uncharacterized protein PAC_13412 [Phialocephala subalpina]|uniref:Uncharacterized protein n=1 Tax=Phialocephala subalpina TaxID=576137 RepID=A0A1L7XEQ3_9HELO|nr:uncharacterized protein PAC_13412 [Phialocephala subalpina]
MVTIAIAGGTTGIGSNVVREILATNEHRVVVLSRSERPALEEKGVCIWSLGPDFGTSQLALLKVAEDAGVKRFVPSDWATDYYGSVNAYAAKTTVWNAVKASGLEYTRFITGIWMNLWGLGTPRNEAEALSGYAGPPFLIYMKKRIALIPGDGSQKVVFTNTRDKSYAEVVDLAESITAASFGKTYYPESQIKTVLAGNPDPEQLFFHQFMQLIVDGGLEFKANVNSKFPDIKPVNAEEYLTKYNRIRLKLVT